MLAPAFRLLSDKENSQIPIYHPSPCSNSLSGAATTKKNRLSGIGRAPPIRKQSQQIHGDNKKPYARQASASVQRAKHNASGHHSTGKAKTRRPAPLDLGIETPSARKVVTARIPLRLPVPCFPPIPAQSVKGSEPIPVEYILPRLRPQFPALLVVSSLYRPYPPPPPLSETSTNQPIQKCQVENSHSHQQQQTSIPFGIPSLVSVNSLSLTPSSKETESLRAKIEGREPDVCLGITQKGSNEPMRLVPVNQLVYSTQCSYWPTAIAPSDTSPSISPDTAPMRRLDTICEDPDSSFDSETSFSSSISSSSSSSTRTSSWSSTLSHDNNDQSLLDLPIIPLPLPSASTFHLIHTAIHLPSRPFLPVLLELAQHVDPTESLEKASTPQLMQKLKTIHGVWANLCTLGVSDQRIWREMGQAWSLVVGVLSTRVEGRSQ